MIKTELDPYRIDELKPQLESFGYDFHYTPETASTMILAEKYVRAGNEQNAIFLTDHQTKGIGREGRVWLDKKRASILVTGVFGIEDDSIRFFTDLIALHTNLILRREALIDNLYNKYPNDLVIDDKKVGGMLMLNHYDGFQYKGTSVGIGINVHYGKEELEGYPTDYGATALDLHSPKVNSRQKIVLSLFEKIRFLTTDAAVYENDGQNQQNLNNLWRSVSSVLGRTVRIEVDGEALVEGRVMDTQIGEGILVEGTFAAKWFNQFDTKMKVRLLN